MLATYEAVLQGNKLKWKNPIPRRIAKRDNVTVYVTILDEKATASEKMIQGRKMADALESLSVLEERSITDPLAWQVEVRQDRPLPR